MITLPTNFITDLVSTMGGVMADIMPLVLLIVGILLACYVLRNIFWSWVDRGNGINK